MFDGKNDISTPDWVESGSIPAEGLDLLGLRNPVQQISNRLLSGITTITPQIRYLTFRAWIIKTFTDFRLPSSYKSFVDFAARMESAIVIGNLLNDKNRTGLVGSTKALETIAERGSSCQLEKLVNQIATSIYQNPSVQLGIAFNDPELPFTGLTKEIGVPLAEAFAERMEATAFYTELKKNKGLARASRESLLEFGEISSLGEIPLDERRLLTDIVVPSKETLQSNPRSANSLATYTCLLELAKKDRRIPEERDLFLASTQPRSPLSESLDEICDGWLLYTIRDMIAAVHESALEEVTDELERQSEKGKTPFVRDVIRALMRRASDIDDRLQQMGFLNRRESYANISIRMIRDRLDRRIMRGRVARNGLVRWNDRSLTEINLYDHALGYLGCVGLLPIAWLLAARRVESSAAASHPLADLFGVGDWWRIGIPQVIQPTVDQWLQDDLNLQDVVRQLVERTIDQHLRITWERNSVDPRKDVSVFGADEDRLIYRTGFTAGRTGSRLAEAIGWLRQLGLIGSNGITDAGNEVLGRSQWILGSWRKGTDV